MSEMSDRAQSYLIPTLRPHKPRDQASTDSTSLKIPLPSSPILPTMGAPVNHCVQSAVTLMGCEQEKKHLKTVHCLEKYISAIRKEACDPLYFKGVMINLTS